MASLPARWASSSAPTSSSTGGTRAIGSFDDFLAALASRKRKADPQGAPRGAEGGIEIEWVDGRDITEAHWDAFFAFYMDTGARKWGRPI